MRRVLRVLVAVTTIALLLGCEGQRQAMYREERLAALRLVQEYLDQKGVSEPAAEWFGVKDGGRLVVGFKLYLGLTSPTIAEWQVKEERIVALNGHALSRTPELEEEPGPVTGVSERDKDVWARYEGIMTSEVEPEYYRRAEEEAEMPESDEASKWYDRQERSVFARVAKEFQMSAQEAEETVRNYADTKDKQYAEFAESRAKILSEEELDILIAEQGELQ